MGRILVINLNMGIWIRIWIWIWIWVEYWSNLGRIWVESESGSNLGRIWSESESEIESGSNIGLTLSYNAKIRVESMGCIAPNASEARKQYYLLRRISKQGIIAESGEGTTQHLRAGSRAVHGGNWTWSCQHLGRTLDSLLIPLEPSLNQIEFTVRDYPSKAP